MNDLDDNLALCTPEEQAEAIAITAETLHRILPARGNIRILAARSSGMEIWISARLCEIAGELSGGVVIKANVAHAAAFKMIGVWGNHQRRLRPGWTRTQFVNAAVRCITEAVEQAAFLEKLMYLATLVEKHEGPGFDFWVNKMADNNSMEVVYLDMRDEDIEFWMREVPKWQ